MSCQVSVLSPCLSNFVSLSPSCQKFQKNLFRRKSHFQTHTVLITITGNSLIYFLDTNPKARHYSSNWKFHFCPGEAGYNVFVPSSPKGKSNMTMELSPSCLRCLTLRYEFTQSLVNPTHVSVFNFMFLTASSSLNQGHFTRKLVPQPLYKGQKQT